MVLSSIGFKSIKGLSQSHDMSIDSLIPVDVRVLLFEQSSLSPSKRYKFVLEQARVKFTNIIITRAIVTSEVCVETSDNTGKKTAPQCPAGTRNSPAGTRNSPEIIAEIDIQQDPQHFWHCWVQTTDKKEFLLTKGIRKGALLISMAKGAIADLVTDYDWRDACISPNNDKLAVACSKESKTPVRVFDFRNIQNPPYLELQVSRLPDIEKSKPYESDICWKDNIHLQVTMPVFNRDKLAFNFDYYSEDIILEVRPFDAITSVQASRVPPTPVNPRPKQRAPPRRGWSESDTDSDSSGSSSSASDHGYGRRH